MQREPCPDRQDSRTSNEHIAEIQIRQRRGRPLLQLLPLLSHSSTCNCVRVCIKTFSTAHCIHRALPSCAIVYLSPAHFRHRALSGVCLQASRRAARSHVLKYTLRAGSLYIRSKDASGRQSMLYKPLPYRTEYICHDRADTNAPLETALCTVATRQRYSYPKPVQLERYANKCAGIGTNAYISARPADTDSTPKISIQRSPGS